MSPGQSPKQPQLRRGRRRIDCRPWDNLPALRREKIHAEGGEDDKALEYLKRAAEPRPSRGLCRAQYAEGLERVPRVRCGEGMAQGTHWQLNRDTVRSL